MVVFGALMRDLEPPTQQQEDGNTSDGKPDNTCDSYVLENSERLCSSMVQLPTYLEDSCPEVISELSSKEGTHLNSLLEQHPYILDSIIKKDPDGSVDSSSATPNGKENFSKKRKRIRPKSFRKSLPYQHKSASISGKLNASYLRNLKVQRGSITYRGAMLNIHRYRLKASSCPDIFFVIVWLLSQKKDNRSCDVNNGGDKLTGLMTQHRLSQFSTPFISLRATMEKLQLQERWLHNILLVKFLLYACVDIPYVYVPDHAITTGTDLESASLLVSVLGVLNCLGVVIVGYVGDKPWLDPSLLYSGFILISGVSLALIPVLVNYYATATLVGIYGFTISANYTLIPVIIVNLISLDNFTGAYGLLLLVQGIASLVGPPAAGALFDETGNYDITFYTTGLLIIVSGALVIPIGKSLCKKTSNNNKDLVSSESRKVKFQDPLDVDSVKFLNGTEKEKFSKDKIIFSLKESTENSRPLLSCDEQNSPVKEDDKDESKIISMYSNPLSNV
ncbi:monocarboxylate transporter 9 [Caerostris extrusa]|uniref:Monocarboxylate transporter 9 n=1 Tax=Caerostris extrusa TaxID=172846 RepID=A0AAV4TQ39_CAEEX|nr:monocarboxylate transporter 9 [Caerostris extrusa]